MQTFEAMWESSRNNEWSFVFPLILVVGTILLVLLSLIRIELLRQTLKMSVLLLASYAACYFSSYEIEEKWRIRIEYGRLAGSTLSQDQSDAIMADGANRIAGPIAGGIAAFLYLSLILLFLFGIRGIFRKGWSCQTEGVIESLAQDEQKR